MRYLIAGILLALALPSPAELKVGDTAPEFSLEGSDGNTYSSLQFQGKKAVVLAFFPKVFTGG